MYLLDTNIIIYVKNKSNQYARDRIKDVNPANLNISIFTLSELLYGCEKSSDPKKNKNTLVEFLLPFNVIKYDNHDCENYGKIRAYLEIHGQPIGVIDTFIGSMAVSRDLILVTNNVKEFERIPGIKIENWAES
ncbi:type II toxin-antitoxin system tRNA(fMet)-specific endonuclease VapC [Spirochaeta dissipatitropha]